MSRFTPEEKLAAVRRRLEGRESCEHIAYTINTNESCIREWCRNYEVFGKNAFIKRKNNHYTLDFKTQAVEYYLNGKGSLSDVCRVFGLRSQRRLLAWVQEYNSHKLKASPGIDGGARTMTKGRKTTLEERLAIVEDHIRNGSNYAETARKFNVSYGQVYQWVQKYKDKGLDGLKDNRGRTKPESEMTENERLRAENRMLKAELEFKKLEYDLLKKVEEIERRRS